MGRIFYIMGKSASGKDHIYEALEADPELSLQPLVICTTRPMRKGEADGREYHFVSEETLERLRQEGRVIEERCYQTVQGPWYYFTADDGRIDPSHASFLGIGTLESYVKIAAHFGRETVVPLYIEVDDGLRLERALRRERKQPVPQYEEMCRRYLVDARDFSEENLQKAGIERRFSNDGALADCVAAVRTYILGVLKKDMLQ